MTYQLYIGDRTFSSWSLRGWLMLEKFDLPYEVTLVGLYSGTMQADLARIDALWSLARHRHGADGPWLFGKYSLADVFYAPVAMRITAYDLPVSDTARTYVKTHLSDPAFIHWRTEGLKDHYDPWPYPSALARKPWPEV